MVKDTSDMPVVPADTKLREAICARALEIAKNLSHKKPPQRMELERLGHQVITHLDADEKTFGYAMIEINNEFWRGQFASVPFTKRILLLPRCLDTREELAQAGEKLGYRVLIAEGTPQVLKLLLEEDFDAVLGVACLDSLDKAFARVSSLGIANAACPLLEDGCKNTTVDAERLQEFMNLRNDSAYETTQTYIPLLRKTVQIFDKATFYNLLGQIFDEVPKEQAITDPMWTCDAVSLKWLRTGGKRLRPFVTLAAYAVSAHGAEVLSENPALDEIIPDSAMRVALAIETLHKASLVHDDIEDDDRTRYGEPTLHKTYGVPFAINSGDYLVGLGYRLISGESEALGSRCTGDILAVLSDAHLRLCRGQASEMMWQTRLHESADFQMTPLDALTIYAAKTSPAFEAALYAGLRMGGRPLDMKILKSYTRSLGVGFQVLDDLNDWENGFSPDAAAARPTLLFCFAYETADEKTRAFMLDHKLRKNDSEKYVSGIREIYSSLGVFDKAQEMVTRYRIKSMALARECGDCRTSDLLEFVAETIFGGSSSGRI